MAAEAANAGSQSTEAELPKPQDAGQALGSAGGGTAASTSPPSN